MIVNPKMTKEEEDEMALKIGKTIINGIKDLSDTNKRTTHLDHMGTDNKRAILG